MEISIECWTITNDRLSGGNMIIRQDGTIESRWVCLSETDVGKCHQKWI